jgi:hypothetical protein
LQAATSATVKPHLSPDSCASCKQDKPPEDAAIELMKPPSSIPLVRRSPRPSSSPRCAAAAAKLVLLSTRTISCLNSTQTIRARIASQLYKRNKHCCWNLRAPGPSHHRHSRIKLLLEATKSCPNHQMQTIKKLVLPVDSAVMQGTCLAR